MKLIFITLLFIITIVCYSQKHDYTWVFGYANNYVHNNIKAGILDFNDSINFLKINYYKDCHLKLSFTNSSYSDLNGNLLAISDGFDIYNKDFQIMSNGDSINFGPVWTTYRNASYPDQNSCVFLSVPDNESLIYLIHRACEFGPNGPLIYNKLFYSLIDQSMNSGKGNVISKNKLIFDRKLIANGIAVAKHANGRDSWMIQMSPQSNLYYIFLIDPFGIKFDHEQNIGPAINSKENYGNGNDVFTLDGGQYASFNIFQGIVVMNFDRCSGTFSSPIHIPILLKYPYIHGSVAFSPSGRFLYFNNADKIIQFDLWNKDFPSSGDTVARHDGIFPDNISTYFGYMQIGPDGKIYMSSVGSSFYIHCIDQPDRKGLTCNFIPRKIKLDGLMYVGMPPMPNYRLGALINSGCDTINTGPIPAYDFKVFPNPSTGYIKVQYNTGILDGNLELHIYNLYGSQILTDRFSFFNTNWETDISSLSPALYFYEIKSRDRVLQVGKIIKN